MKRYKGKLIVLEGTDGSGKGTQTKLLVERLRREKYQVATLSFPQYGKKSAGLIEEYLNGAYGVPDTISPYAASLFYALDRFDAAFTIRMLLAKNDVVVLDRYVDSNAGHQGGKIKNPTERKKFLAWLYDLEYRILGVPKPDLVIILHVPARIGQKLIAKKTTRSYIKKGTRDRHESNLSHLKNAENSYLWLAKEDPKCHKLIECTENGLLLSPENIHQKVWSLIHKL
ncbi:MAG: thymidylate kinase Tmk [Parcubacteria group bacterium Gr01-1014_33]|nr:MAG: thymidylate kinase Tmk [Parcubacteria group bacterium Gr01-1014_33]